MNELKQQVHDNIKNIPGWRTSRKLVVFSVDDYGNVRLDSPVARESLNKSGITPFTRFDAYDTLETREDIEALADTLSSVKDVKGRPACFTAYALSRNPDFEEMAKANYDSGYKSELLTDTFSRQEARYPGFYSNTWRVWQEAMNAGLLIPEFHGREHININYLEKRLKERDKNVIQVLSTRSLTNLAEKSRNAVRYTAAFSFWSTDELMQHEQIIKDGLKDFSDVFGRPASVFTPPAGHLHASLIPMLKADGLQALDRPFIHREHLGEGKFRRRHYKLGTDRESGLKILVRNVVFEPTIPGKDHIAMAMKQIAAAFRWGKPANISSHRVNFCGLIDETNRKKGLDSLRELLKQIVTRWPDVEFVSAAQLAATIK